MEFRYSGDGNPGSEYEELSIKQVTEDLVILVIGEGVFDGTANWSAMGAEWAAPPRGLLSIRTQEQAQKSLERIDNAIVTKDKIRAHLGALQNRLENTVSNLQIQAENVQASESRISDTDVATEMTEFIRGQVMTQAGVAMLAQANSLPQMAVQLING